MYVDDNELAPTESLIGWTVREVSHVEIHVQGVGR